MRLFVTKGNLLLEAVKGTSSRFNPAGDEPNKYTVAYGGRPRLNRGETVYLLDTLGEITIDGQEYTVAEESQVVAYEA